MARPLSEEGRQWLEDLEEDLWPKEHVKKPGMRIKLTAKRPLTFLEFKRVQELIESYGLLTSFFCTSMFGGYGMDVLEHELFPGTGPRHLLRLVEDNLPDPHRLLVSEEGYDKHVKRPGEGRDDAWEAFSKYTHTEHNIAWLKAYKMELPRSRTHYDY